MFNVVTYIFIPFFFFLMLKLWCMKRKNNTPGYSELPFPPEAVVRDRLTFQDGIRGIPKLSSST